MLRSPARRQATLYVALLTITLLLLAFSSSGPLTEMRRGVGFAMAPIQNVLRGAGEGFSSFFGALGEIDQLRQQNQTPADAGQRAPDRKPVAREPAGAEPTADRHPAGALLALV